MYALRTKTGWVMSTRTGARLTYSTLELARLAEAAVRKQLGINSRAVPA